MGLEEPEVGPSPGRVDEVPLEELLDVRGILQGLGRGARDRDDVALDLLLHLLGPETGVEAFEDLERIGVASLGPEQARSLEEAPLPRAENGRPRLPRDLDPGCVLGLHGERHAGSDADEACGLAGLARRHELERLERG